LQTLHDRRIDAWTALAAEPAVRAAERSLVTRSDRLLADTLAVAVAAEARRRHAEVAELKARADADPARREAYARAADDLRSWAAGVYLAALGSPRRPAAAAGGHTEESVSVRRSLVRPPFPGQRKRRPQALAA